MFFSRKALALTVVMLSLASCAFREDSEDLKKAKGWQEAEESFERNKGFATGEIKHEFIPGAKIHDYSARLSWPTGRSLVVTVERSSDGVVSSHDSSKEGDILIPCIQGYASTFVTVTSPKYGVMSRLSIPLKCPVDMEISSDSLPVEALRSINGSLYIGNALALKLVESDLNLNLIGLIVNGSAAIETFGTDRRWTYRSDYPGLGKAPQINIKAKWATGHLRLQLNGVDGKPGRAGEPHSPAAKGARGADGVTHIVEAISRRGDPLTKEVCRQDPTSGGPGADGAVPGKPGDAGGDAIGTSNVKLDIENSEAFALEIDLNPGKGGPGGAGSPGQDGGPGGDPGSNHGGVCHAASAGAKGRKHPQDGAAGVAGSNGSCGLIQLSSSLIDRVKIRDTNFSCSKMPGLVQPIK
ncbi:MAG: collagen-like protein [Bdellovibrionales bacterium]|nr:collagen-like protein [Bdellovibrionales bacterium]